MIVFYIYNEDNDWHYSFPIETTEENYDHLLGTSLNDVVPKLEESYNGVLDGCGTKLPNGQTYVGYQSYEIKGSDYKRLTKAFRSFFVDLGYTCGDIQSAKNESDMFKQHRQLSVQPMEAEDIEINNDMTVVGQKDIGGILFDVVEKKKE